MQDIDKIKRNVSKMIDAKAPEADIDAYLDEEGVTVEQLKASPPTIEEKNIFERAIENTPDSAMQFLDDATQIIRHPIDTSKTLVELAYGVAEKMFPVRKLILPKSEREEMVEKVADFYKNRYGSVEQAKETFATDPVGFLADTTALFGSGSLKQIGRTGKLAKIENALIKTGRAVDPTNIITKPISASGKLLGLGAKNLFGLTTGAGADSVEAAYKAGARGGRQQASFLDNLRGNVDAMDIVNQAERSVRKINKQMSDAYTTGMKQVKNSDLRIDFSKVDDALQKSLESRYVTTKKGRYLLGGKEIATKVDEINNLLDQWRADPELQTVGNVDALKQAIDGLYSPDKAGPIVLDVRNAIKNEIVNQVPAYADVMAQYEKNIKNIQHMKKELSLNKNINPSTTMRKLQGATRNNATTAYGDRIKMIDELDPTLFPSLAGQALNNPTPRGLQGAVGAGTVGAGFMGLIDPVTAIPSLLSQSPRVVGEAANLLGRLSNAKPSRAINGFRLLPTEETLKATRALEAASEDARGLLAY